jgi:hypothetical protein
VVKLALIATLLLGAAIAWSDELASPPAPQGTSDADAGPVFPELQSHDPHVLMSALATGERDHAEALLAEMRKHPETWMTPAALQGIHSQELDVATDCLDFLTKVPLDASQRAFVRDCIGNPRPPIHTGAMAVAVAQRDCDAIQPIISAMQVTEHGRDDVLKLDAQALTALTNLNYGPDANAWQDWFECEDKRVLAAADALDTAMGRSDETAAVQCIRDLSSSPIEHDLIQERLTPLASSRLPGVRAIAGDTLRALGLVEAPAASEQPAAEPSAAPPAPVPTSIVASQAQGGVSWLLWLPLGLALLAGAWWWLRPRQVRVVSASRMLPPRPIRANPSMARAARPTARSSGSPAKSPAPAATPVAR